MFNKIKFRQGLIGAGYTLESLSREMGINPATLHRKMNGESDFTRKEIQEISKLFHLDADGMNEIFFAS